MAKPVGFKPFYHSSQGIQWYRRNNGDGTASYAFDEDVQDVLDMNKAMANHNDGWMSEKWGRRAARIPMAVWLKWLMEDGVDVFKPEGAEYLKRKLNDPDWRYLRTAEWTV